MAGMEDKPTKAEIERRAGELAARVMKMPPQPRKRPTASQKAERGGKPLAHGKTGEAS